MSSPAKQPSAVPLGVESVISTEELQRRPARAPDFKAENGVLLKLASTMAREPHCLLQEVVDSARGLCEAGSAGLSLLDADQSDAAQFRWVATSGEFEHLAGTTLPRDFSPCTLVLHANRTLLLSDPARAFPYLETLPCPVHEVLLVPFYCGAEAVGTLWIASHTRQRQFDSEDARLVTNLSTFAAAAVQLIDITTINQNFQEGARLLSERELERLEQENRRIAALIDERERVEETIRRELQDTRRLRDVAARLIGSDDGSSLFGEILAAAIEITQADGGSIQLIDHASQTLTFLATSGFSQEMVAHFSQVDAASGSPCGVALAAGERVYVQFNPGEPDPDGSVEWHLGAGMSCAQSTPLLSRSGQRLGMLSTHWRTRRDLAERELRFLDLIGRQAADLIERTQVQDALRASERELREGARRKDEFLAVLAHELRNPLAPIRNGIELLKRAQQHPTLIGQIHPIMERQVGHMVRLIDDLLDVSRITSGKVELKRELVSLWGLIGSAVEANRTAIAAANLELQIDVEDRDRLILVDATRLSQVVSNILHNATKFTPAGGKITVQTAFTPEQANQRPELILQISDTGIGIRKEVLPTIFELFTQARPDGSARHGGLGIGLALARSLVELHGGIIYAESLGPDQGSQFTIQVPVPKTALLEETPRPAATGDDLAGLRVLVVDDNRDAADAIGMLISESGGDVRIAYGGIHALETLREFDASLVLLDIGMPEMDGYQVCRQIRLEKGAGICIVAVTGWGQQEDRRRTAEAGFDAHLTKPVDFARLTEIAVGLQAPRTSGRSALP